MNPFLVQDFPPSRWDEMCRRLEPLLGDVRNALGPRWHEKAEAFFTEADFIVAETILSGTRADPDWFIIRYAPGAQHLDDWGDGVTCAQSWSDALAVLLRACESNRFLPNRVECDAATRTLRLFVGDALLATLMPLPAAHVSPEHRRRAMSTVTGLRKSADPEAELIKRARRWPSMSDLVQVECSAGHDMHKFRERMAHQPIPREWLQSARLLCAVCSKDNPDTSTIQSVAAAALGATSWNHLAGPHGDFSARLLQPWYVCKNDEVFEFHADAIDAFADLFLRASRDCTSDWTSVALESGYSIAAPDYVPYYALSEPLPDGSPRLNDDHRLIAVYPVCRSEPKAEVLARVAGITPASSAEISALFGVGLPLNVKAMMLDERSEECLIAQSGPWRFTRHGGPRTTDVSIVVHRVGVDGNSVWSAAVPAYKGLLQIHPNTGCYVLCADYDGAHPVAVIDQLDPVTAAQIRSNLLDTSDHLLEFREDRRSQRDRDAFRRLLDAALRRRSLT